MRPLNVRSRRASALLATAILGWFTIAGTADAQTGPCVAADDGGTATLPPRLCAYQHPTQVFLIIDGLPPGSTIELSPVLRGFGAMTAVDGGSLGGQVETFGATMIWRARGIGAFDGYERLLVLPLTVETHSAPRIPGDPVQSFATDVYQLNGSLASGDPDFQTLQISAGTFYGRPSPGQTTLTERDDGNFHVDSFFDVAYQIVFVGQPGGPFDGMGGATTGTSRVEAAAERDACVEPDDGTGTTELPPTVCEYLAPGQALEITDGLPPGTTIEVTPRYRAFSCGGSCGSPGGNLGGEVSIFISEAVLQLEGTGSLDGFRRTLRLPLTGEIHTAPRTPGTTPQSFATEMVDLQGSLFGDPDFAQLTFTAGSANGLAGPGHTTLTGLGGGDFQVDSFFDIAYQFDFEGAPGGTLDGLSGSTQGATTLDARSGQANAVAPDDGKGTATLPPEGSSYVTREDLFVLSGDLPVGTTIEMDPKVWFYFCTTVPCGQPGGTLGGEAESFQAILDLELTGTGDLSGLRRRLQVPVAVETHSAPRQPPPAPTLDGKGIALPPQVFDTDLHFFDGVIYGDPDFAQLRVTAGTGNDLPSPGHATLRDLGDGTFQVDSFFDVEYRIDFVGAPGGTLDGLSGISDGTARMTAAGDDVVIQHNVTIAVEGRLDPTDFPFAGDFGAFDLDDDVGDPTLPSDRTFFNLLPNVYAVNEITPPGWDLIRINCDDPDGGTVVDVASGQVQIDLDLGEAFTCTFVLDQGLIFTDGFESGNVSAWSSNVGGP